MAGLHSDIGGSATAPRFQQVKSWHVVGDSHVCGIRRAADLGLLTHPCDLTEVRGATAVGLRNPNGATDAIAIFKSALLSPDQRPRPVFQLGEVDCGFVIWYRARKYNESVDAQLRQSIDGYCAFVDALLAGGYGTVVITAAALPTIRDGHLWGPVANARREISTTLRERTDLTFDYNALLRRAAERRGSPFIDLTDQILDHRTRLVSDDFCHPDPDDHHLDSEKTAPLWARELNRIGKDLDEA